MSPLISEKKENFPILIVDKIGDLGFLLADKLSESSTIVLFSERYFKEQENIIYIPYKKKIPKIPDNLYSHIFVIDDGEDITLEALPSFLKKAQTDRAIFSFCTSLERKKLPPEIFEYAKSKILYLGDIFPQTGFFPKSYVNRFLTTARNRGRIDVPQDGMAISYPIFLEDAVSGLLEASFGTSNERVYYIFPKDGATLLSLAHNIQKKNPDVKIDFTNEEAQEPPKLVREGKFVFQKYNLDEKIRNLDLSSAKTSVERFEKSHRKGKPKGDLRTALFALLFFLFLPLITTLITSFLGFLFLDASKLDFENSKSTISLSKSSFSLSQKFSKALLYETSFISLPPLTRLLDSIEKGKRDSENISGYHEGIELLGVGKINEGTSRIKDFLVFAQTNAGLKTLDKELFNFITQSINIWPQIAGADSNKSYLILFQNDKSLRGVGGTVESFGILTLENGKIADFKVFDSNKLNQNLKGHVEPPFALRRHLNSPNFYLADAAFDTDFGEVAKMAQFFVDLETRNKVDGVIRVDGRALGKLVGTEDPNLIKKSFEGKNLAKIILTKEFVNLVNKKDVIFSFNDKSLDKAFAAVQTVPGGTINDLLSLYETDLNQTPALGKKVSQKVEVKEDGIISSLITLNLENSNDKDTRKYLRFLVHKDAVLRKVSIDGENVDFTDAVIDAAVYEAKDFNPPKLLEVEKSLQNDKEIVGFLTAIPKNKSQKIELAFEYPGKPLADLQNFDYSLHFLKQPGENTYPFDFSISFPSTFKIYSEPKVSKTTDRDFDLTFHFTK